MSQNKDLERVARSMLGQRLEIEYVRFYMIETYQLDEKSVDHILERIGYQPKVAKGAKPPPKESGGGVKRQTFY